MTPINTGFNGITTFAPPTAVAIAPNGRFVYYTTDTHYGWARINDETGGYAGGNGNGALGAPGKNALALHPSGRFAYITIGTDPGFVERYLVNPHTGVFSIQGSAPTIDRPHAITIDPMGRFAYVASAGNSVMIYTVNQSNGELTLIGDIPVSTPVAVAADYSGRYLHVLSLGTRQVFTYSINQTSGALTLIAATPAATGDMPMSLAVSADMQ